MSEVQTPAAQATPTAQAQTEVTSQPTTPAASTPASPVAAQTQQPSEAQPKSSVVPEKYDLKLPEGSTLDPKTIEAVASFAKEKGLSQEVAQAVLEREHLAIDSFAKAMDQKVEESKKQWLETSLQDKEFGGDNLKLAVETGHRALKRFDSTGKLTEMLNSTGFGNHPEVVRFFYNVGKHMAEDKLVVPGAQVGGKKSIEDVFYGGHKDQET